MNDTFEESIIIENVVVSSSIGSEIALDQLSMDLPGADYDPEKFPGLIYRTDDPKASLLIFRSGKLVCTGASSIENAKEAVDNLKSQLEEIGLQVNGQPTEIQNIVASGNLGESLNLNAIAIGLGLEAVEYEPEQFPGLVYRMDDPDAVVLVFGSGRCVITGTTHPDDSKKAIRKIADELETLGLL